MKKISTVVLIFVLLASSVGILPGLASSKPGTEPGPLATVLPPWLTNFLPFVFPGQYSVTGQVLTTDNTPVEGVTITDSNGSSVVTNENGSYSITLSKGANALTASKAGMMFTPSMMTLSVNGSTSENNFTALADCTDYITNGTFESTGGWTIAGTPAYLIASVIDATDQAFSATHSARTGIPAGGTNAYGWSAIQQTVAIPSDATSATLTSWFYRTSSEVAKGVLAKPLSGTSEKSALAYDIQYALVMDANTNLILEWLSVRLDNTAQWQVANFDLSAYKGRSVKIEFGTFNDGIGGVTALYVDDVSLSVCQNPITPTSCANNQLINPSFETNAGWVIPATAYSAFYSIDIPANDGTWSMHTGITNASLNRYSYSSTYQDVYIPNTAVYTTLNVWLYTQSGETAFAEKKPLAEEPLVSKGADVEGKEFGNAPLASDVQYILVVDPVYGTVRQTLWWHRENNAAWHQVAFDLSAYRGQTIRLQFGTYNDGWDGITSMYVDNVCVDVSTTAPTTTPTTPTVTATATTPAPTATTPAGCSDVIGNTGFEAISHWYIPWTAFSAGYSNATSYKESWSMRSGIVYPYWNRYSYSDFSQMVSIPSSAKTASLTYYYLPTSTGLAKNLSIDKPTMGSVALSNAPEYLSNDVQYLLVLDWYGNWIDTLMWERTNSSSWLLKTIDLSNYIGSTIRLQWGTYNDGWNGVASMYVDEVHLNACP